MQAQHTTSIHLSLLFYLLGCNDEIQVNNILDSNLC